MVAAADRVDQAHIGCVRVETQIICAETPARAVNPLVVGSIPTLRAIKINNLARFDELELSPSFRSVPAWCLYDAGS